MGGHKFNSLESLDAAKINERKIETRQERGA